MMNQLRLVRDPQEMSADTSASVSDWQPQPLSHRSDDDLVLIARGGQPQAFTELVQRHQKQAMRVADRYFGNTVLAQEAAQNAFVELFRNLPNYHPQGCFSSYFYRILINQCKMMSRKMSTYQRFKDDICQTVAPQGLWAHPLPNEALLLQEKQRILDRALQALSPKLRIIVVMRYSADLSQQEIAEALNIPLGTVKSRLGAGMEKLRKILKKDLL